MVGIFDDSDDIMFGAGGTSPAPERTPKADTFVARAPAVREFREHPPIRTAAVVRTPAPARTFASRPTPTRPRSEAPVAPTRPSLIRLIESMKPSFLPISDAPAIRFVSFSDVVSSDPMFLMRAGESTLLFGTGFSTIQNTGMTYTAFPDMRLAYNERDRLAGWIISNPITQMKSFQMMLEALGFPHVYASRDIIANIRESIKDTEFLDKCRFFELFPTLTDERKVGEFLLKNTSAGLHIISGGIDFTLGFFPADTTALESGSPRVLSITEDGYRFSSEESVFLAGEIIEISQEKVFKHHLKFTFDTFYLDANSVGVALGYALKDRSELAASGVLTFVLEEDRATRSILGHIFIDSRGFVHSYEMMGVHKAILSGIRKTYEDEIIKNPRLERSELVHALRREITKYCFLLTGRTPVVMPVILER